MDVITFEKNAYLTLIKKIDEIHQELQRLKDPAYHFSKEYIDSYAAEREGIEPSEILYFTVVMSFSPSLKAL